MMVATKEGMVNSEADSISLREADDTFTVHQGNSLHLEREFEKHFASEALQEGFIGTTITSPPYGDVIEYDTPDVESQIGFGDSYETYIERLRSVFETVYDYTVQDGSLWIIVDSYRDDSNFVMLPTDIIEICQNLPGEDDCPECGAALSVDRELRRPVCNECEYDAVQDSWDLHDVVIWDKERARPYTAENQFRNVFEYVLCFTKSETARFDMDRIRIADPAEFAHWWVDWPERYNLRGTVPDNIWEMVTPSQGAWGDGSLDHPAPFPPKLIERIIRFSTTEGDVVFDPFAGTGTTVAQANLMDRRGIGLELSEEYTSSFPNVKASLERRWEDRTTEEPTEVEQYRLAKLIWGLRQLVYGKKLALQLRRDANTDDIGQMGLNSLLTLAEPVELEPGEYAPEKLEIDLRIVFDTETDIALSRYQSWAEEHTMEEPWIKFGISADVTVQTVDECMQSLTESDWAETPLYLYPRGRHYEFARTLSVSEWYEQARTPQTWRDQYASKTTPPLLSPVQVHVDRSGDSPTPNYDLLNDPPESDIGRNYGDQIITSGKQTSLESF